MKGDAYANALAAVRKGGVIIYPTETICGIGCDARNEEAIQRIFSIKNRPANKSVLSLFSSEAMLLRHFKEIPDAAWDILDMVTKPTTLILDQAMGLAPSATGADGSAAVRWVKSGLIHDFIQELNAPLISTSVNLSGQPSAITTADVDPKILEKVDFVLPEPKGYKASGKASSIIRIKVNGEVEIIRK